MDKRVNPVVYFEIPVTHMNRAMLFYKTVFNFDFELDTIDGNEMAFFPFSENGSGISGALAKGDSYKPTTNGTLIYFTTKDIDTSLRIVQQNGGKVLFPKTSNDGSYFVAEFEDSEGNKIGLHMVIQ